MIGDIHLDTNYLIQFAGGKEPAIAAQVLAWIELGIHLHVSAMAWAEFRSGPLADEDYTLMAEITSDVIPLTKELADRAGLLFGATGRRSRSLADCIIAATVISEHGALATVNRADFEPFLSHGLKLA